MRRIKKIKANFNILQQEDSFNLLVLKFINSFRSKRSDLKLLVASKHPTKLSEEVMLRGFNNIDIFTPNLLLERITQSKYQQIVPVIFAVNFSLNDVKEVTNIIDLGFRHSFDVELFFEKTDEVITDFISKKYLYLLRKVNLNLYLREHFRDIKVDESWRWIPGPNAIRR